MTAPTHFEPHEDDSTHGEESAPDLDDATWDIEFPGLNEVRAEEILQRAREAGISFRGEVLNERDWLRLRISRPEARAVLARVAGALRLLAPTERIESAEIRSVLDRLDAFLEQGDPYLIEVQPGTELDVERWEGIDGEDEDRTLRRKRTDEPAADLFLPGLSEDRARRILDIAEEAQLSIGGIVHSPAEVLSLLMDRMTAQWLRAALTDGSSVVVALDGRRMTEITAADALGGLSGLIDEDIAEFAYPSSASAD